MAPRRFPLARNLGGELQPPDTAMERPDADAWHGIRSLPFRRDPASDDRPQLFIRHADIPLDASRNDRDSLLFGVLGFGRSMSGRSAGLRIVLVGDVPQPEQGQQPPALQAIDDPDIAL